MMKKNATVLLTLGKFAKPLQNSATHILSRVDISKLRFIEKYSANQDYDFYWLGSSEGVDYQVRGDSWEPNEPQLTITVTLIGKNALEKARTLVERTSAAGWHAQLREE